MDLALLPDWLFQAESGNLRIHGHSDAPTQAVLVAQAGLRTGGGRLQGVEDLADGGTGDRDGFLAIRQVAEKGRDPDDSHGWTPCYLALAKISLTTRPGDIGSRRMRTPTAR